MANKYNNKKVVIDGITFDSIKESQRYGELKLMEKAGEIRLLVVHPVIELQEVFVYRGKKIKAINYEADFWYIEYNTQKEVYEDVKGGCDTQLFRVKWKMLLYKYKDIQRIEFRIVR